MIETSSGLMDNSMFIIKLCKKLFNIAIVQLSKALSSSFYFCTDTLLRLKMIEMAEKNKNMPLLHVVTC